MALRSSLENHRHRTPTSFSAIQMSSMTICRTSMFPRHCFPSCYGFLMNRGQLPTSFHESIVGHVHPRATIENVRTILIRELYQRTSDPHTEWLKCKMEVPRDFINPKYFADFQRRFRKDIQRNTAKKNAPTATAKQRADTGYHAFNSTKADASARTVDTMADDGK